MTIREYMHGMLGDHGLWPAEADKILAAAEADRKTFDSLCWGDSVNAYPDVMMPVVWLALRRKAIEWIDANAPKHFARAILTEGMR